MSLKRVTRHKKDGSVAFTPLSRHKTSVFVANVWIASRTDSGFRAGVDPGLDGLVFGGLALDFFFLAATGRNLSGWHKPIFVTAETPIRVNTPSAGCRQGIGKVSVRLAKGGKK